MAACGAAELFFLGGGDSHSGGEGGELVGKSGAAVFVFNLQTGTKRHVHAHGLRFSGNTDWQLHAHFF